MKIEFKNYTLLSEVEHIALLKIRNSQTIRENSKNTDVIDLTSHLKWVEGLKMDKHKLYYAVIIDSVIQGGINAFNLYSSIKPSWGLFFKPDTKPMISSLVAYIFLDRMFNVFNVEEFISEVNITNRSAYRFSLNFGLQVYDAVKNDKNEYYLMQISKSQWNTNKNIGFPKMISKRVGNINFNFR